MADILMIVAYVAFGLTALLMVLAILLQEGKGGGLSALGGTQAESAFGSSNPIRRATVILSVIFFLLAGVLTFVRSGKKVSFDDESDAPATLEQPEGAGDADDADADPADADAADPNADAGDADAADADVPTDEAAPAADNADADAVPGDDAAAPAGDAAGPDGLEPPADGAPADAGDAPVDPVDENE